MKITIKRILATVLALSIILCLFGCTKKVDEKDKKDKVQEQTEKVVKTNPLTGIDNLNEASAGKRPIAVMVENSPAARPQWGLGSPDITLEGLVEGGITRMLWLYADVNSIPKIGPARSARIDFLEMAEGLDALYVHFGGAASAYDAMRARGVDDLDGGNNAAAAFSRDSSRMSRGSEHTAYTTGERLASTISSIGRRTDIKSEYSAPFAFNDDAVAYTAGACNEIKMTFSPSYKHTFKYNSEDKLYYNFMNANEMVDENGKQMSVTNVIVLYYPGFSMIPNTKGSIDMNLSEGTGVVASNGTYAKITWTKGGPSDMLKLMDENGQEFKLNKGKSYIALIPDKNASATTIA